MSLIWFGSTVLLPRRADAGALGRRATLRVRIYCSLFAQLGTQCGLEPTRLTSQSSYVPSHAQSRALFNRNFVDRKSVFDCRAGRERRKGSLISVRLVQRSPDD